MIVHVQKRCRRPIEFDIPERFETTHDMVLDNRRLDVFEIVEAIGIPHGLVSSIFNDYLCLRQLSTKWVSRLLTIVHKLSNLTTSKGGVPFHVRGRNIYSRPKTSSNRNSGGWVCQLK